MCARLYAVKNEDVFVVKARGREIESAIFVGPGALRRARRYACAVYEIWDEPIGLGSGPDVGAALGCGASPGGATGRDAAMVAR